MLAGDAAASDPHLNTQIVIKLLNDARQEAKANGATYSPVLSPIETLVTGSSPVLDFREVQKAGFQVVVWTVNNPATMAELISRRVDGVISDRPDLLREELAKARRTATTQGDRSYFARFDLEGHRGGRDLRPENTLPAFESGLDQLITTIETDTGVTSDHVSLISHEPFINPQTCRRLDGADYNGSNQVLIKNITMAEAQQKFICDKVIRGPQQKNNVALSPSFRRVCETAWSPQSLRPNPCGSAFRVRPILRRLLQIGSRKNQIRLGRTLGECGKGAVQSGDENRSKTAIRRANLWSGTLRRNTSQNHH